MKSRAALHASAAMSHSPTQLGFIVNTLYLIFTSSTLAIYFVQTHHLGNDLYRARISSIPHDCVGARDAPKLPLAYHSQSCFTFCLVLSNHYSHPANNLLRCIFASGTLCPSHLHVPKITL